MILPAQFHFISVVFNLTLVHVLRGEGDDAGKGTGRNENAGTVFLEDITAEVQFLIHGIQIQADVGLNSRFPGDTHVAGSSHFETGDGAGLVGSTKIVGTGLCPNTLHVHESGGRTLVATYLTD